MHLSKKTKIVATLGPASDSPKMITDLILAGVNVFRFNTKHADTIWHVERIVRVKEIAKKLEVNVGVLLDLQGPEIRCKTKNGERIEIKKGMEIKFVPKFNNSDDKFTIEVPRKQVLEALRVGDKFSINDGFVSFEVSQKEMGTIWAIAENDYELGTNKGFNAPGINIPLSSLTRDDLEKLESVEKIGVDFIGLSFCRSKKDILALQREMLKRKIKAAIIAKIESKKALDNIDEIIEHADAIMVARGDMGVELPIEQLAHNQKVLIEKCRIANKPVLTATQMLDSMTYNPMPTRAEATDVANAVLDGTDAIMLSGETTAGKYPLKTVEEMAKIATYNENFLQPKDVGHNNKLIAQLAIEGAVKIAIEASDVKIAGFIVATQTGLTARMLSSYRNHLPIIAVTDVEETHRRLCLSFGINSVLFDTKKFLGMDEVVKDLQKQRLVFAGRSYILVHGTHWKKPGLTNSVNIITL